MSISTNEGVDLGMVSSLLLNPVQWSCGSPELKDSDVKLDGGNVVEFHKQPELQRATLKVLRWEEWDSSVQSSASNIALMVSSALPSSRLFT